MNRTLFTLLLSSALLGAPQPTKAADPVAATPALTFAQRTSHVNSRVVTWAGTV